MPWCHTCRVEYRVDLSACPECHGRLNDVAAPEQRRAAMGDPTLVVLVTLPPEQALLAAGRLDAGGIPTALRDAPPLTSRLEVTSVDVLVEAPQVARARRVLRGRSQGRRTPHLVLYGAIVVGVSLFLSAIALAARWFLTGSPLPR